MARRGKLDDRASVVLDSVDVQRLGALARSHGERKSAEARAALEWYVDTHRRCRKRCDAAMYGAPAQPEKLNFALPGALRDQLVHVAELHGRTEHDTVRLAIRQYLDLADNPAYQPPMRPLQERLIA